jgi:alkaline phosphatase
MQLDKMDGVGLQMTHSMDTYVTGLFTSRRCALRLRFDLITLFSHLGYCSFITDSANSATAIMTGHKSTVNALGVYRDSSPNPFDDPKVETIAERKSQLLVHKVCCD